jgi:hypothetical protein
LTLSPAVKVFALLGVLATLALGAGMFVLGGQAEDVAFDEPLVLPKKKTALVSVPDVANKKTAAAKPKAVAKPKPVAKPRAVAKPKPKPRPVVAPNGLPTMVMSALAANAVVVVSLFDDAAKIDPLAHGEAQAGAALANAGFVSLDVTRDQKAAEALMLKLGTVLRAPMVLVYTRPGELAVSLDGFRDRDTVAQAALNALR